MGTGLNPVKSAGLLRHWFQELLYNAERLCTPMPVQSQRLHYAYNSQCLKDLPCVKQCWEAFTNGKLRQEKNPTRLLHTLGQTFVTVAQV